jgi:BNR repeat-like domain
MFKNLHYLPVKVLLVSTLGFAGLNSSIAQMDHSVHSGMSMSSKPPPCEGSGLDCANAATPFLTSDSKLLLAWTSGGKVSVAQSVDMGKTFSPPVVVAEHGKSLDTGGDARPQIVSDAKGNVFLAYAFFKDKNWNAQINKALSGDSGKTFTTPESLVVNGSSERFPSMLIRPDNSIFITWIDKRLIAAAKQGGVPKLGGSIAYSFSNDGGKIFQAERIANEDSCECCRIGVSLDPKAQPVIVYRAIFPGSIRDHATQIISSKGLEQMRRVSKDEWKTDACPHHGPSIAVSATGAIHTAWFTQGKARSGVFYANSHDQGKTYSTPIRVGKEGANVSRPYLLAMGKSVWLVWKEFDGQSTLVLMKKSSDDGKTWSPAKLLAQTSEYSDHPLIISRGDEAYLSWLTRADGYQLIKIGQVE